MLSPEEQAAFQQSIAGVRAVAGAHLGRMASAQQAVDFVQVLHHHLDAAAQRAAATGTAIECQAGCDHCCHLRVEATHPEVLRIARHLRALPAAELQMQTERLQCHVDRQPSRASAAWPRQPCSFLADQHCTIYPVRPAACRKAHSLSAQQCADGADAIPQNLHLLLDAEALMAGTAQAYEDARLDASTHELNTAVLTALQDPAAAQRWFSRQR